MFNNYVTINRPSQSVEIRVFCIFKTAEKRVFSHFSLFLTVFSGFVIEFQPENSICMCIFEHFILVKFSVQLMDFFQKMSNLRISIFWSFLTVGTCLSTLSDTKFNEKSDKIIRIFIYSIITPQFNVQVGRNLRFFHFQNC